VTSLLVGQPFASTANTATVYVSSNPTNWAAETITTKNLPRAGIPGAIDGDATGSDRYGYSVAIEGGTALVGAPWEASNVDTTKNNGSIQSGAAYLFHSENGNSNWSSVSLVKRLKAMKFAVAEPVVDATFLANFGNSCSTEGKPSRRWRAAVRPDRGRQLAGDQRRERRRVRVRR
jgi:FG-GAP repeat